MSAPKHTPTKAQLLTLRIMEHRDRVDSRSPIVCRRIGMMRIMEERGLVSRNSHGEWSITRRGLDAIAQPVGADASGCSNPECACVPYDGGSLSSERMPWQLAVDNDGWPMVHNGGDVICVPDPNHHAGCTWDAARFRLIAAAPDLLEALQRLSALTPGAANAATARDLHLTVKAIADEAVAKATGEGAS